MTANIPALVNIKFACPHCGQHIACDSAYCGTRVDCPSCGQGMAVPRLAAFAQVSGKSSSESLLEPWTDEEWSRRADAERALRGPRRKGGIALQSWFWIFFLGPLLLFFYGGGFHYHGLPWEMLIGLFFFCAIVGGFLMAKLVTLKTNTGLPGFVFFGITFSVLLVSVDLFVCYFGGCAMACTQELAQQ